MNVDDALLVLDRILAPNSLNNVQEQVFRHVWEEKSYTEIAQIIGYDPSYIRDVGYRLWRDVSQVLGERVSKSNIRVVLRRQVHHLSQLPQPITELTTTERELMNWLALTPQSLTARELQQRAFPQLSVSQILELLTAMHWRGLVSKQSQGFALHPDYIESQRQSLLQRFELSLYSKDLEVLTLYPLTEAIAPILKDRLLGHFGSPEPLIDYLRHLQKLTQPWAIATNSLHLLIQLLQQEGGSMPTESSDLRILQRLIEAERAGGLITWEHHVLWSNNLLGQKLGTTKQNLRQRHLADYWLPDELAALRRDLQQRTRLRKQYHAWQDDHTFAYFDAEFEAVFLTDHDHQPLPARLVFVNEIRPCQPPADVPSPHQRRLGQFGT
jgi:DNA-binding CsgD family transcriptional regulator